MFGKIRKNPDENIQDMETPEVRIQVLNPIECAVRSNDAVWFQHELEFPYVWYRPANPRAGIFSKQRVVTTASAFSSKKGDVWRFYSGLLPRIKRVCKEGDYKLTIIREHYLWGDANLDIKETPHVEGIEFRDDQIKIINDMLAVKRGCCVAPTAYGKTVVMLGLASCFWKHKILIMVDKKAIVDQTYDRFKEKFPSVNKIHGTSKPERIGIITIATKQSISNMIKEGKIRPDEYDLIMVDEVHHVSSFKCQYGDILKYFSAPFRFGFTGTFPDESNPEKLLALESFIGPVITQMSPQEAEELDLIATAKVMIVKEERNSRFKSMNWQSTYHNAVVNNEDHNIKIAEAAINEMDDDRTVLIFVNTVDHMLILSEIIAESAPDLKVKKVHSSVGREIQQKIDILSTAIKNTNPNNLTKINELTEEINKWKRVSKNMQENAKNQNKYRQMLIDKQINGVIATSTWREGVDIPTLDTVILAAGGKESQKVLQEIGRGHRMADGKSYFKIIDFFNPSNKYLIEHFGLRFCEYLERRWEFVYE